MELLNAVAPLFGDAAGIFARRQRIEARLVDHQRVQPVELVLAGVKLFESGRNLDSQFRRIQRIAIGDEDVYAAAFFSCIGGTCWREVDRDKAHACDFAGIQRAGQGCGVDPGRAEQFKGRVRSPSYRNVGSFDHADARIKRGFREAAHVRRGIDPKLASGIEPVAAHPALQGNDCELRAEVVVRIEKASQLTDGHAVAHGSLFIGDKRFPARIRDRAFNVDPVDGVGAVEHDDWLAGRGGGFKKVAERALVGVEADAHVLNVKDDRVEAGDDRG